MAAWRLRSPTMLDPCLTPGRVAEAPPAGRRAVLGSADAGLSRVARPGLEPGTPRFSVMDRNLSNSRGIPAFEWVLAIDPHQLDVRKLRSFRVDLGTESRFGAQ